MHLGVIFSGNPGANRGAMQRRRPLNDTIPEIRRMKEEREKGGGRREEGEGETVGKIFIWGIGRWVGSSVQRAGMYRQSNIIKFPFDRSRWRLQTLVKGNKRFPNGDVQETGHFDPSSAISDRWEVGRCTQRERERGIGLGA